MSEAASECVVFQTGQLLPEAWRHFAEGPVRAFNPGLLRDGDGWILAYRIVGPDGVRRIGICRLDAALRIVSGSPQPLTDHVRFRPDGDYPEMGTQWFADPRLYRFSGRVFLYWNSGWHEPRNCQFLQELEPTTLRPLGHPRELALAGPRQKLEKNWTFFQGGYGPGDAHANDQVFAIYSILPHRVLTGSLTGKGDLVLAEVARTEWSLASYPASHGGLRGGAPPVVRDGIAWAFCHSVHDGAAGYCYAAAVYGFSPHSTFEPTYQPIRPLRFDNPLGESRTYERLNPAVGEVIYPCGAAWDGARWVISHGINDEYCAISLLSAAEVASSVSPVTRAPN